MKTLLIGSTVDDGSTSMTMAYKEELKPDAFFEISKPLKGMSFSGLLKLGLDLRRESFDAGHIICIQHSALMLAGIFASKRNAVSMTCMTDWSPNFPSQKKDLKTRIKMILFMRLLKRFSRVYIPIPALREHLKNSEGYDSENTLLPPPYGNVEFSELVTPDSGVRILFMGGDFKRKGGEELFRIWGAAPPHKTELTLVTGRVSAPIPDQIKHLTSIKARTSEHRALLSSHHLFLLPSFRESYGFAALEALNYGQVVVVTRVAGISSLIEDAGGIVADSPAEAIEAAINLANHPDKLLERQLRTREFALKYRKDFVKQLAGMRQEKI